MSDQATQLRELVQRTAGAASRDQEAGSAQSSNAGGTAVLPRKIVTLSPARQPLHPHAPAVPHSALTGAVSFGPACSRISSSQVNTLSASSPQSPAERHVPRCASAIAISSGKGGVGKSNVAVNLAVVMSQFGLKVCLLDADLGLANDDVLCNLSPRLTLADVVSGKCRLADAMLLAPGGFRLIPGASGVARMADLTPYHRHALLQQLCALEKVADVILIDCGAGISANVVAICAAANSVVITTTPEPTAITDGYAMIKSLLMHRHSGGSVANGAARAAGQAISSPDFSVLVNMVNDGVEAEQVFARIDRVSRTFLNQQLRFAGWLPVDPAVPMAVRQRMPFVLHAPDGHATHSIRALARRLLTDTQSPPSWNRAAADNPSDSPDASLQQPQRSGFFSRMLEWMRIVEYVD